VTEFHRPAQRLLVQGVLASTSHLVRELRDGAAPATLRRLMAERRRMLGELGTCVASPDFLASMQALNAAVAESDRTVEALIG
jgi:hypothetical protein